MSHTVIDRKRVTGVLRDRFGFDSLRPLQASIVDRLLGIDGDGGDALVVMPTGSGKSLCFQLPGPVMSESHGDDAAGVTVVFSPLIALMEDQALALKKKGVRAAYINSTLSKSERDKRCAALGRGEYEIIYATPERMARDNFVEALDRVPGGVNLLAVDEAHCVSRWGHDLRPAYQQIGAFRERMGAPRTVALTATATSEVREDIRRVLGRDERSMPLFSDGFDRPNLSMVARTVHSDDEKLAAIVETIEAESRRGNGASGIVYFSLIRDLEEIGGRLRAKLRRVAPGVDLEIYHGRLEPREKKRISRRFAGGGSSPLVIAATPAFGMGVDKPDIRFIVHAQLPQSIESYYQEVGRAGRDGLPSTCVLCYQQDDLAIQQEFIEWANPSADLLIQTMAEIDRRYSGDGAGHATFDSDDLRLDVVGKGHAHGKSGGRFEYALTTLAKHGAIEESETAGKWRYVRTLDDDEIDAGEIAQKRERDLRRLLSLVQAVHGGDLKRAVLDYFEG